MASKDSGEKCMLAYAHGAPHTCMPQELLDKAPTKNLYNDAARLLTDPNLWVVLQHFT